MPNWCSNIGYICLPANASAKAKEIYNKLADSSNNEEWFGRVFPAPHDWGTKWDVVPLIWHGNNDKIVNFSFDSAWGPPLQFFEDLQVKYGIEYSLNYNEPSGKFAGRSSYIDGVHSEITAEGADYELFVIKEFDEPINFVIDNLDFYENYNEFLESNSDYANNNELLQLIKEYYENQSSQPVLELSVKPKKKVAKKKVAKKKVAKKKVAKKKVAKKKVA